jgi:hypothetical protein
VLRSSFVSQLPLKYPPRHAEYLYFCCRKIVCTANSYEN